MKETILTKIKRKKHEAKEWIRKRAMKAMAWIQVKTSMKKRAIKGWINRTFHKKKNMIRKLEAEVMGKDQEIEALKKRFRRLGSQIRTIEETESSSLRVVTTKIDIEPLQFGDYIALKNGTAEDWKDEILEEAKSRLAEQLATALMENNMIQFIVRDQSEFSPLDQFTTVAVRVNIVPWEQMAVGKETSIIWRKS